LIFQDFNLLAHLSAPDSVGIGLIKVKRMDKQVATELAMEELRRIDMGAEGYLLSGIAFRRTAAARVDCESPGAQAQATSVRRTEIGSGSGADRRGASRHG
jgi:ABC-type polar amino acid transport system ATPase subunit